MIKKGLNRDSFLVQILNDQNATWQGTITWTDDQKTVSFRSALELIKLIDSALDAPTEEDQEVDTPHFNPSTT